MQARTLDVGADPDDQLVADDQLPPAGLVQESVQEGAALAGNAPIDTPAETTKAVTTTAAPIRGPILPELTREPS